MTDEELMLAYADGDIEAFEALYLRHKMRVFGFLLARLKERDEAEDVFQAVFVKLHRARTKYRPEIPFLPWIFTITRNCLIDHIRKRETHRKHVTISEEAVQSFAVPDSGHAPTHLEFEKLSSLSKAQRQALQLRFEQGLSFRDVAEQMQTSADNARQIISRAIRKLRKQMTGKEMSDESR